MGCAVVHPLSSRIDSEFLKSRSQPREFLSSSRRRLVLSDRPRPHPPLHRHPLLLSTICSTFTLDHHELYDGGRRFFCGGQRGYEASCDYGRRGFLVSSDDDSL